MDRFPKVLLTKQHLHHLTENELGFFSFKNMKHFSGLAAETGDV